MSRSGTFVLIVVLIGPRGVYGAPPVDSPVVQLPRIQGWHEGPDHESYRLPQLSPRVLTSDDGEMRITVSLLALAPKVNNFRADQIEGAEWYKRAMRAHANCIENLPVFGAIVFALYVGNVTGTLVDGLAVVILVARVMQSLVHVCFEQSNAVASVRFGFFSVQIVGFLWLLGIIVSR
jgi:uncharacterized MAPEG superfamily protein